jgi:hypothetical protein
MDVRQLEYFLAIVDREGFNRAASAELHLVAVGDRGDDLRAAREVRGDRVSRVRPSTTRTAKRSYRRRYARAGGSRSTSPSRSTRAPVPTPTADRALRQP